MSHMNAQIVRLYDTVFDRAPDAGGLEFWNGASHNGFGLRDLANFFIAAPEFAATYGEPTNRGFVESMYLNVLDRPGELEGINFWTNALDAGLADRPQIVVGFSESAEHVEQMARPQPPVAVPPHVPEPPPPVVVEPPPPPAGRLIEGANGNDTLQGGPGGDIMIGGPGNDTLYGGEGDDVLVGGPGGDRLFGGPGNDTFLFRHGDGQDAIVDLQPGDRLLFEGVAPGDAHIFAMGGKFVPGFGTTNLDYILDFSPSGSDGFITLQNITGADLGWVKDSFIFA